MLLRPLFLALAFAANAGAAILPGFRIEHVTNVAGFCSSVAVDSRGTIYYTTTQGTIARVDGSQSTVVANVVTEAVGNSGLLGMTIDTDEQSATRRSRWQTGS